ncbi:helix-turn-helix protein [Mucilaginibacter frigoritolerans]|uniref:Helix-turn-helix protein n=1 Tax=Mucilaginibacter frigoritolerans TaxID=652788 RepID=A0A562TYD8_9SPHI|nr:helix-turn-helix transcriptional regulator [Mucilaginibacter frigoritolerans]TWI98621.1 helix-turn-helix protein [Mucilaginibacter frigoritolerans]
MAAVLLGELALRIGLHPNVLGRHERGEAIPSIEVAARIAKALDISLDYLSELTDTELDTVILTRINEIASLSEEEQKQVYMVVDALIRDYKAKKSYPNK